MQNSNPLVTVVIPTRNRPDLVGRAVRSALLQTLTDLEVVVVVDGPDPSTFSVLATIQGADSRLRVLPLPQSVGGADARNAGIETANGEWIAMLDDDDEWIPQKLEKQVALGETSSHHLPLIFCKFIGRTPATDYIWPRTEPFLPIADYCVRRRSLFQGEGVLGICSTVVGRRALFQNCPFTSGQRRFQDVDWLIRACSLPGVGLEFIPEPLAICYMEENRASIGSTCDWHYAMNWANSMQLYFTPEGYASFCLTTISTSASNQGDWSAFVPVLVSAFKNGKPRVIHIPIYFGMWLLPMSLRRFIRRVFQGISREAREHK